MRNVVSFFGGVALITFLALATGCSAQPKFESPADYIGASYASIKAAANTTGTLYESGQITREQAQEIYSLLVEAWNITVMAESLLGEGKPQDALETLRVAQKFLALAEQKLQEAQ